MYLYLSENLTQAMDWLQWIDSGAVLIDESLSHDIYCLNQAVGWWALEVCGLVMT